MNTRSPIYDPHTTPRFGAHLRKLRKRLGLTQAKAAVLLDVSSQWVSNCERGFTPHILMQDAALTRLDNAVISRAKKEAAKEGAKEDEAMNYAAACAAEPHITGSTLTIKRVKDHKSGQLLGYAPINCRAYEAHCAKHPIAVRAGEWIWSGELPNLWITADHRVYFE